MQTESLHIVVINYVQAEVEQVLAVFLRRTYKRTNVEFQFLKYAFVNYTVAVNKLLEQRIFFYCLKIFFRYVQASCA